MPSPFRSSLKRPKAKLPPADAPIPRLVEFQKGLRKAVPSSPHYNDDPAIPSSFLRWNSVTDQLESESIRLGGLLGQVQVQRSVVSALQARYFATGNAFLCIVEEVMIGNLAGFLTFSLLAHRSRGAAPIATVPLKLRVSALKGQPGHYIVRWLGVDGAGLYELEQTLTPEDEASYAACYSGKTPEFAAAGVLGQTVSFRVRARGNETSPWSTPVSYVIH